MIKLFEAAKQLQAFCDAQGRRSCFIGGLAVQKWGGHAPRWMSISPCWPDLAVKAGSSTRHRVLLLRTPDGVGIDVSLGALPFEERVISRASLFSFGPGLDIRTCSAEDFIVLKLFASRPLDVRDAEGVAVRQGQLDWQYIEDQLRPLAEIKGDPATLATMARLRELAASREAVES